MPWPERTLTARTLAGVVGAIAGALVGFIWGYWFVGSLNSGSALLLIVVATAGVSFVVCFSLGDPAVRFLLRMLGGWRLR